jgi:hypothetical protein
VKNVQNRGKLSLAIAGLMISMTIPAPMARASDVWLQQARGRISGSTPVTDESKPKTAPEGGSTAAAAGSPTNPATCNQQNASSTACYSATQQTRGK